MYEPFVQTQVAITDVIALLDDGENDDKLIQMLAKFDASGYYADMLLRKYLALARSTERYSLEDPREFILCSKLVELAPDRRLLVQWVNMVLDRYYWQYPDLEAFILRRLNRGYTQPEAKLALAKVIARTGRGVGFTLSDAQFQANEDFELNKVAEFVLRHNLDLQDSLADLHRHYQLMSLYRQ